MSYKQIDEQLKLIRPIIAKVGLHNNTWKDETISPAMSVIKQALHLIYDQAKAEQAEADARVVEGKKLSLLKTEK